MEQQLASLPLWLLRQWMARLGVAATARVAVGFLRAFTWRAVARIRERRPSVAPVVHKGRVNLHFRRNRRPLPFQTPHPLG